MSLIVMERATSRALVVDPKAMAVSREYWVRTDDPAADVLEVNDAVAIESPNFYLGMRKKRIKSNPQGGGFWHAVVEYGQPEGGSMEGGQGLPESGNVPQPEQIQLNQKLQDDFSFSTAGGTQHIVQSIATREQKAILGRNVPNTRHAIGVSKNGIAGCDVIVPKFELSITKRIAFVTMAYIDSLVDCTGCVNSADWNTIKAYEALFLGAEGRYDGNNKDDHNWLVTYKFLIARNQFNIDLGGDETTNKLKIDFKAGHDYLWVGYQESIVDVSAPITIQTPWFANVEQVYHHRYFQEKLGF